MTIDSFAEYLITHVKKILPSNYRNAVFTVMRRIKPGDLVITGIAIRQPCQDISPCFHIDELYAEYLEGINLPTLVDAFAKWLMKFDPVPDFQTEWIKGFGKAKDYIVSRLIDIRPSHNDRYLEGRPVNRLGNTDIGIIYELDVSRFFEKPDFSIPVTGMLIKCWSIQLPKTITMHAAKNTPRLRPPKMCSISEIIKPLMDTDSEITMGEINDIGKYMFVLTNTVQCHGANVILYLDIQEPLNSKFPDGYYIPPTSVHETIIVPKNVLHPQQLLELVTDINKTKVSIDERLADDVFIVKDGTLISVI